MNFLTTTVNNAELKKTFLGRLIQINSIILIGIWILSTILSWVITLTSVDVLGGMGLTLSISLIPPILIFTTERLFIYLIFGEKMFLNNKVNL